jgi:hypothetical protein
MSCRIVDEYGVGFSGVIKEERAHKCPKNDSNVGKLCVIPHMQISIRYCPIHK